jgi:deoxyribonuclease V
MPQKGKRTFGDLLPFATLVQKVIAGLYKSSGIHHDEAKVTLALDVAYTKDRAYAAAVVYDVGRNKIIEEQAQDYGVHFPYVPGYLYLREAPPLLRIMALVESTYDLILIDAHGRLHPRRAGLATIVGVLAEKPTVGLAKSLLKGEVRGRGKVRPVYLGGEVEGWYVSCGRPFYASPGNLMSLQEVRKWLRSRGNEYPSELIEADRLSKELKATSEAEGPS